MLFLAGEIVVLLVLAFVLGAALAAGALRLVLRRTADQVSAYVAEPGSRR